MKLSDRTYNILLLVFFILFAIYSSLIINCIDTKGSNKGSGSGIRKNVNYTNAYPAYIRM